MDLEPLSEISFLVNSSTFLLLQPLSQYGDQFIQQLALLPLLRLRCKETQLQRHTTHKTISQLFSDQALWPRDWRPCRVLVFHVVTAVFFNNLKPLHYFSCNFFIPVAYIVLRSEKYTIVSHIKTKRGRSDENTQKKENANATQTWAGETRQNKLPDDVRRLPIRIIWS